MQIRARLVVVNAKAASTADAPNKLSLKLDPLYLTDAQAGWLFDHLGQYLELEVEPALVPRTPLEEAIDRS